MGPSAEKYIMAAIFRSKAENVIPAFVLFPKLDRAYIMTTHINRLSKELHFCY
jgi:hypothetical protein